MRSVQMTKQDGSFWLPTDRRKLSSCCELLGGVARGGDFSLLQMVFEKESSRRSYSLRKLDRLIATKVPAEEISAIAPTRSARTSTGARRRPESA